MSVQINGTNGLTFNDGSSQQTAASGFGFKNRIINGAMMIDQRNAGASGTTTQVYTVDRWNYYTNAAGTKFTWGQNLNSVTPPVGFSSYFGFQTSSAYTVGSGEIFTFRQTIEGFNISDLAWGTANAKTVTLSFQVYSSLTGTFGGSVQNSAQTQSYPFSYSIPVANTWTQISITIPGSTSGAWVTNNGAGLQLAFSLATGSTLATTANAWASGNYWGPTGATSVVGTNGATFYITGVQLEKGSTATSFDYRPYGTELALCQRYYEKSYDQAVVPGAASNDSGAQIEYSTATVTGSGSSIRFAVTKRGTPTVTAYSTNSGTSGKVYLRSQGVDANCTPDLIGQSGARSTYSQSSGILNTTYHWVAASEL